MQSQLHGPKSLKKSFDPRILLKYFIKFTANKSTDVYDPQTISESYDDDATEELGEEVQRPYMMRIYSILFFCFHATDIN